MTTKSDLFALSVNIIEELQRARAKHPDFPTGHHGLAVIEEEVHELRMIVYEQCSTTEDARERMTKECIQIAAMAMRFVLDLCEKH